ncbi:hypothetical protein NQ318_016662 [Aromia moschata]|uniref:VPS9 domain-containing protein n=1 Tax=Aromia moschata TaxID=1265417 RepID=A0AAV8Y1J3_9CUCU|nr:hypothetical protein NQ318_016662 [Aromia moschata]
MWSQYDENLGDNLFFKEVQHSHSDIIEKASKEGWIICVPRVGTLELVNIPIKTILDHILVPSDDQNYCTLSKKHVNVHNKHITIDSSQLFTEKIEILFEETFYVENNAKYTVWCLDRPLFLKYNYCNSHGTVILENLHDCIDFLWVESHSHGILDSTRQLTDNFTHDHGELEAESLQTQKELIGNLYSHCLQACLKSEVMREKCSKSSQFLENLKVSVEAYMQYCLGRKLIFSVNTLQYQTDACINKITRNANDLQLHDLGISDKFCDVITLAKCELNKLNNYITVLDKIFCFRRTFNIIYESVKDAYITSDDLLQILAFLVAKLNVTNWAANLTYIKEFRYSLLDNSDQNSFVITTLEAALEFIKSNQFLEIRNKALDSSVHLISSHLSVQNVFDQIKSGEIKKFEENLIELEQSLDSKLCHPLCSCEKCQDLTENYDSKLGFDPNNCNEKGQNLLIIATLLGNCDIVELLLEENVNVNFSDCLGRTALHYAACRGHQDILLLLINSGANVNAIDSDKNMPLHFACSNGHENCVKGLIYSSAEVELNIGNFFGDTPLNLATKWGYLDIVKILLENGASVIVKNKRNQTVVHLAPNYYILKLLEEFAVHKSATVSKGLKEISDVTVDEKNIPDNSKEHGLRPKNLDQFKKIDLLLKAIESNDLPLACFYLGFSCGPSKAVETQTCHPLCNCENCQNDLDFESELIRKPIHSININTCNVYGYTPLHVAAKFGRTDILRLLLDCGALPNVQVYKSLYTPLHLSCIHQRVQVVRELVKCGECKVDAQDAKGNTPLFYACLKNDVKIVEILLSNGADCNKKNFVGRSALNESEEKLQYRVFKLLKNSLVMVGGMDNDQSIMADDKLF